MGKDVEETIMDRIHGPGWVTTRGVLKDPSGQSNQDEVRGVEDAMKRLAEKGLVILWRLKLEYEDAVLLAAARPGLELDRDLEERGAAAKAERYSPAD